MADAQRELTVVISARDEVSGTLKKISGQTSDFKQNVLTSGAALASVGAATTLVAKGFVDAAGEMEATKTAFRVLIGNSQLAEKTLKDLFTLESRTPFTIQSVLTESKKLLAMGTNAKDLTKTLEMLGDVAAGVGFEKLPQLTLAFGQIQAKGRLMGTELRQLTEAGFNLADAMGVSNARLDEMITNKEVGFEQVRAAFEKVTGEGGRFNGMMDQLSQTTPGRLSTLESSVYKLQVAFGTALLPAVNSIIDALIPAMEQVSAFAQRHQTLTIAVVAGGLALGILGTTMLLVAGIVIGLTATISVLGAIFSFVTGIIGVTIAVLGGPLTIAILAVMALVALFAAAYKNNWLGIKTTTDNVVNWLKTVALPIVTFVFDAVKSRVLSVRDTWVGAFNAIRGVIEGVIGAIRGLISAAQDMANRVRGGLKIPGFQHGGFVPGAYNQAVPAILHGGERVIPRNGVDVNPGMGGGSAGNVTVNISGSFNLDSDSRVQELADKIVRVLGRQNELAGKGLGI